MDGETHRYFPDFYVKSNKQGEIKEYVIEIKPKRFARKPQKPKRKTDKQMKRYKKNLKAYQKNVYKWKAAKRACEERGYEFYVITEDFFDKTK